LQWSGKKIFSKVGNFQIYIVQLLTLNLKTMKKLFLLTATIMFFASLVLIAQEPTAEKKVEKKECTMKADTAKAAVADTAKKK
jgi:hypothetical protein